MTQRLELLNWIDRCSRGLEPCAVSRHRRDILGFIVRFGSNVRAILTKEKNGCYLALFLDKHKYYEEARERWGF